MPNGVKNYSSSVTVRWPNYVASFLLLTFQSKDQADDDSETGKVIYTLEPRTGRDTHSPFSEVSGLDHCLSDCTGSDSTLQLIKSWEETCAKHHDCGLSNRTGWLPTRLLDVRQDRLRLVNPENLDARYTTLSHCWGRAWFLKLKERNMNALSHGFPIAFLPKTFQDAISVTRTLGIDFIWIDSLCIIQDSKDDWEKEASHMGQVYESSYCNLAATDACNATEGLFFKRNIGLLETFDVQTSWRIEAPGFRDSGLYTLCPEGLVRLGDHRYMTTTSPLNDRGWVLQEQLLAPRNVSFGKKQVTWFCRECEACEAFPRGVPIESWREMEMGGSLFKGIFYHKVKQAIHGKAPDTDEGDAGRHTLYNSWVMIVREYTRRNLTFGSDNLAALNGITNLMAQKMHCKNHAGILYRKDDTFTILQLLWLPIEPTHRPEEYRAPSWSWASVEGAIEFARLYKSESVMSTIEYMKVQTEAGNTSGQVIGGTLCITGPLASGTVFSKTHLPLVDRWDNDQGDGLLGRAGSTETDTDRFYDIIRQAFFLVMWRTRGTTWRTFWGLCLRRRQDGKFERLGRFIALDSTTTLLQKHAVIQTIEIV
ncbi:hypothetical protein EG328_005357 [Venturia inaequalis]|uniref:Heterokaryon incompatibility domain-containing protein n=1 Tax=Venturia inaequalis TaxID=5025 RepID=A0A8H3UM57_VENIN|nr:hypothetical protein EG328_005357 [Venturia inaequalis]